MSAGQVLWTPSDKRIQSSRLYQLAQEVGAKSYEELQQWSVGQMDTFWRRLFSDFSLLYEGDPQVVRKPTQKPFIDYPWFPNVRLNYAENLLESKNPDQLAIIFRHESGSRRQISFGELKEQVAALAQELSATVRPGDVVAAYMPNIPETVIGMLAASSLGAAFTSTSCDFGVDAVLERFAQTAPVALITSRAYTYNRKVIDLSDRLRSLEKALPSLKTIVEVDFLDQRTSTVTEKGKSWEEIPKAQMPLSYHRGAFSDTLFIMYSSGTTGRPKCIVHSQGGTLLQHVKEHGLHGDLREEERIFYFTTCGWMMWNWLVSALALRATIVLYEGSPAYPSTSDFFRLVEQENIQYFGTSPKFLKALAKEGPPNQDVTSLKTIFSTGAPLLAEQFDFIYEKIKSDVQVASICGGTDIISCFMLGNPWRSVTRGEIQGPGLAMALACFDPSGHSLIGEQGELVCLRPFVSQPTSFLDDPQKERLRGAYFQRFPGVWHHGDFITITDDQRIQVHGRSDATLNPGGVRIGTAEIYRHTEELGFVKDSLCVAAPKEGDVEVLLFVVPAHGGPLSQEQSQIIRQNLKRKASPRHVPHSIYAVAAIPYTRSGKKMELAVKDLWQGKNVVNTLACANPHCLEEYRQLAQQR